MNAIIELQNWFKAQCNGEWEHKLGVEIETCDNPGWIVNIDLKDTSLESRKFEVIAKNVSQKWIDQAMGKVSAPYECEEPLSPDWMLCFVKDGKFNGAGGLTKLEEILITFLKWSKEK